MDFEYFVHSSKYIDYFSRNCDVKRTTFRGIDVNLIYHDKNIRKFRIDENSCTTVCFAPYRCEIIGPNRSLCASSYFIVTSTEAARERADRWISAAAVLGRDRLVWRLSWGLHCIDGSTYSFKTARREYVSAVMRLKC